tara:strand:+ start:497 stop:781 length:285 start_codon:yes stop_codon:yes gene_type:complete
MTQFLKINPMTDVVNGTSLVNLSDANVINCTGEQNAQIFYGNIYLVGGYIGLAYPDGAQNNTLLDAFEKAIKANPSGLIIPLNITTSVLEYFVS